jgi:hypothetical protein
VRHSPDGQLDEWQRSGGDGDGGWLGHRCGTGIHVRRAVHRFDPRSSRHAHGADHRAGVCRGACGATRPDPPRGLLFPFLDRCRRGAVLWNVGRDLPARGEPRTHGAGDQSPYRGLELAENTHDWLLANNVIVNNGNVNGGVEINTAGSSGGATRMLPTPRRSICWAAAARWGASDAGAYEQLRSALGRLSERMVCCIGTTSKPAAGGAWFGGQRGPRLAYQEGARHDWTIVGSFHRAARRPGHVDVSRVARSLTSRVLEGPCVGHPGYSRTARPC